MRTVPGIGQADQDGVIDRVHRARFRPLGWKLLPNLDATDPTLTMVGWRYHLTKPCPAVLAECAGGENVFRTLVIPKDQLITVTGGHSMAHAG